MVIQLGPSLQAQPTYVNQAVVCSQCPSYNWHASILTVSWQSGTSPQSNNGGTYKQPTNQRKQLYLQLCRMSTYNHDLCLLLVVREQHNYYRSAMILPCHHDVSPFACTAGRNSRDRQALRMTYMAKGHVKG